MSIEEAVNLLTLPKQKFNLCKGSHILTPSCSYNFLPLFSWFLFHSQNWTPWFAIIDGGRFTIQQARKFHIEALYWGTKSWMWFWSNELYSWKAIKNLIYEQTEDGMKNSFWWENGWRVQNFTIFYLSRKRGLRGRGT